MNRVYNSRSLRALERLRIQEEIEDDYNDDDEYYPREGN